MSRRVNQALADKLSIVGDLCRQARLRSDLTLQNVADHVGVPVSVVYHFESLFENNLNVFMFYAVHLLSSAELNQIEQLWR